MSTTWLELTQGMGLLDSRETQVLLLPNGSVAIVDAGTPASSVTLTPDEWARFVEIIRSGGYDFEFPTPRPATP